MRIIPFEIEVERGPAVFGVMVFHLDWAWGDTCLIGVCWVSRGNFWWDLCFWRGIVKLVKDWVIR